MLRNLFNIEAEQSVLGAILYDRNCVGAVSDLKPEDFSAPEHGEMFACIEAEIAAGRNPTAMALVPIFANMQIGPITGSVYLGRLASMSDPTTVRECIAQIKALAARRNLVGIAEVLSQQAYDPAISPPALSLDAIGALNDIVGASRRKGRPAEMIGDAARHLVDQIDDPDDGSMISTGLRSLDVFMGGWPRGELSIIAGRPSMGKSALLTALARRAAKKGVQMLMFSLEMPRRAVVARTLSDYCYSIRDDQRVPYAEILKKHITSAQKQRLASALEAFDAYPIKIEDERGLTMPEIQLRSMRYAEELDKRGKRLDVVMVDHIGKIKAGDRYKGNMVHETGEKSDALMNMSAQLDVALVAAHQLNRNPDGRQDKHPEPADLRDSGNLEQDAHTLIFPYRQAYYLERQKMDDPEKDEIRLMTLEKKKNLLEILVSKSRNGACGTVDVFVDMPSNHVEDLSNAL